MMLHKASHRFWTSYDALPHDMRARADKQFALLKGNPHHPSLFLKKIGERKGEEIWSARVTRDHRALAIKRDGGLLWFWIGEHKVYDNLI